MKLKILYGIFILFKSKSPLISIIIVLENYNDCIVNQGLTKNYYRTNDFKNVVPYKYVVVILFSFVVNKGNQSGSAFLNGFLYVFVLYVSKVEHIRSTLVYYRTGRF